MHQRSTCEKKYIDLLYRVVENKKQKPKYIKIQDKTTTIAKQKTSTELANQAGSQLRDIPRANESDLFQSLIWDLIGLLYFSLKISY